MKPIWKHPSTWEDNKNGMFDTKTREDIIVKCYNKLKENCYFEMKLVTMTYINSTAVNLSKRVWNNQAWLGQAMCNMLYGATINETTKAWGLLTKEEQKYANEAANEVIREWQDENS